jgi:hypothetical protein
MQNNAETNVLYECDTWFMFGKIKLLLLHYVEQLNSEQDKGKAIPLQALGVPEG